MAWCLIAVSWYLDPETWLAILLVAIGLGLVIFVHELGHFAVAKLCGVKVEKFYLGFDVGGWKLARFRWGETEYGIGVVPLGGYVKMLGQEDNPARLREEIERAKQKPAGEASPADAEATLVDVAAAEQALYDPRSYLAQSVPKRMAIISAGVIMNMIFAWILAVAAFGVGVRQVACGVGHVVPGEGAWQAGLQAGDRIVKVAGKDMYAFRDMQEAIMLGDVEDGVPMTIERPGVAEPMHFTVKAIRTAGRPGIGITSPSTTRLIKEKTIPPVLPDTPAGRAEPGFKSADRIVKLDGQAIESHAELAAYFAAHRHKSILVTVQRADGQEATISIAANPMRWLGVVMEMGPVVATQDGSSAAKAGILPGDVIRTINDQPVGDPLTLPDRLRQRAGETIKLGLERGGAKAIKEVSLKLEPAVGSDPSILPNTPVAVPELGVAYSVLNRVQSVASGTAAAAAGIEPGDVIDKAVLLPPTKDQLEQLRQEYQLPTLDQTDEPVEFTAERLNWPFFSILLQSGLPGTTVELRWTRDSREQKAQLKPSEAPQWYNPDRGFLFEAEKFVQTAHNFSHAFQWGSNETAKSTLVVFRSLKKIGSGQVSARYLGGPVTIFQAALQQAREGLGNLFLFLTMLGTNLAVINFLPIPVLDGGHMILLAWEGIRGKPADERVQLVLTYLGLLLILALMVFVLGLDFGLIARPGR